VVEVVEVLSGPAGRPGDVCWLYMCFAASVASDDATEGEYDGVPGGYVALDAALAVVPLLPLKVRSVREDAFSCLVFFVILILSRIWFAVIIDMPQKSGTR